MKTYAALVLFILAGAASAASTTDICRVDFRTGFAYRPTCMNLGGSVAEVKEWQYNSTGESIVVTNSYYISDKPDDPIRLEVVMVTCGDLTGDGIDEAVVTTVCNTGGSGDFSEGYICGMVNGQPRVLAVIPGGDRATGGIQCAAVEHGLLRVERFGTSGGACCPEWIETRNYWLRDGRLVEVGMRRRTKYVEPICGR